MHNDSWPILALSESAVPGQMTRVLSHSGGSSNICLPGTVPAPLGYSGMTCPAKSGLVATKILGQTAFARTCNRGAKSNLVRVAYP